MLSARLSTLISRLIAPALLCIAALTSPAHAQTLSDWIGAGGFDETGVYRVTQYQLVTTSAAGNTTVVAAQGAGVRIRVLAVVCTAAGVVNINFQTNVTAITGTFPLSASNSITLPLQKEGGWFQTVANDPLNINLSAAVAVGCQVIWVQAT